MSATLVLIHLAGAVALLIWATRMVRTGVERAFGAGLRRIVRRTMRGPIGAAVAGALMAIAMQSSTAVVLLVSGFTASGIVAPAIGLAAVLGADLGSALVVKILNYDLSVLIPLCFVAGTSAFVSSERRSWRQLGRILVGLGLILLSLRLIGEASEPLKEGGLALVALRYLEGDSTMAFLLTAGFAWLVHSSVATVLVIVSLTARGLMPPELALVMVLGANLGGAVIAAVLTRSAAREARLPALGNLLLRGLGAVLVLLALERLSPHIALLGQASSAQVIHFHLAFNAAVLVVGLVLTRPVSAMIARALAAIERPREASPLELAADSALDESAIGTPRLALASATREMLRMGEIVEVMLRRVIELYESANKAAIEQLREHDDRVDRLHARIKLYLARVTASALGEEDATRCQELVSACIRLEQVGDIVVRNMLSHVEKKQQRNIEFSEEGWREITEIHSGVVANARLVCNMLVSRDRETARQVVMEKDRLRDLEERSRVRHFKRLRDGASISIESSSIHLDTMSDLKQINSLLASIAYPVLEEQGMLRGSRLSS